jgi:hypothetical protein
MAKGPLAQYELMNSNGDRQLRKQACFQGVNWYAPIAINAVAGASALVVANAGDSSIR